MTWNDCFRAYIEKRWPENPQQEAAFSLRTTPSNIHYWCHGTVPREKWRDRIKGWSGGAVPSELHVDVRKARGSSRHRTGTDG